MKRIKVWDLLVRVFHWCLVIGFFANSFLVDEESALHQWLGYAIVGLIGVRILWGFVGSPHARFSDFPVDPPAVMKQLRDISTGRTRSEVGHTPLGAMMIYNLLGTLVLVGATGYMMTTVTFWGIGWVEELHEMLVGWAQVSVVLHIGAVIWESRRTGVNLPKSMVTGYKDIPEDRLHKR